ncbi:hypothetical protein PV733_36795 [Streptomyces europaeiscabiei]|uniref:hypothetical protein n=1 Tax=Streptomyces europaeiscabiei TaxID=146819 RepID=UPI0029A61FDE|nr:hypothetical protein [Streptomyces europaeiscabiei]MDX3714390.1 hypothetical protein [Streptomyces europaeiscabiei]
MTATETVYATRTGRAFHATPDCRALLGAQLMNDDHKVFWLARNKHRTLHRVQPTRMVAAFGHGKNPCTVCYPELRGAIHRSNSEHDYGHEPMDVITNGKHTAVICARCQTSRTVWWPNGRCYVDDVRPVPWPCTSAIVLGLAPRPAPTA